MSATPVVLVTGVDPDAMAAAVLALQLDLPLAVAVRHHIDPERQVLERTVSDLTGVLEREEIPLEHACVSCALREDIVPTLERVAGDGRWQHVVAHLPLGAEAAQVCSVVARETRLARVLRISGVVAALRGEGLVDDLLGDDLLRERGRHTSPDDNRGVGEVACAVVEYADVVVVTDGATTTGHDLVRTLARPDAHVVLGSEQLEGGLFARPLHDHDRTHGWTTPVRGGPVPAAGSERVWSVDLRSPHPFHPRRLLDGLDAIGGGRHRSRGCFWLPTRPGEALVWDGSGGQLSIGNGQPWGGRTPFTRLVVTGVGTAPDHLHAAFTSMLMTPAELRLRRPVPATDGFEPWLGPLRDAA